MSEDMFPFDPSSDEAKRDLAKLRNGMGTLKSLHEVLTEYSEDTVTEVEEDAYEDDRVVTVVEPPPSLPTTINLFQHPDAHPFVLDLALLRKYGPEWMQWEPEVLEFRILQDFRTNSLSDLNADKLHAIKVLHLRDEFWKTWEVFNPCAVALSGFAPDFSMMQGLTVEQALIAVDTANKIRSGMQWSEELEVYLGVVHLHEGFFCPIGPLEFVDVDSSDYFVDCLEVKERWSGVRDSGKAPEPTTVENEQLRRMLMAWESLEENRKALQDQLPLLYHGRD